MSTIIVFIIILDLGTLMHHIIKEKDTVAIATANVKSRKK